MNCRYPSAVFKLTCLPCLMSEQLNYLAHCVPIKMKNKLVHFRMVYFLGLINNMNCCLASGGRKVVNDNLDNSHVLYVGNFPESNWRGSEKAEIPQSGLLMVGLFKPR